MPDYCPVRIRLGRTLLLYYKFLIFKKNFKIVLELDSTSSFAINNIILLFSHFYVELGCKEFNKLFFIQL